MEALPHPLWRHQCRHRLAHRQAQRQVEAPALLAVMSHLQGQPWSLLARRRRRGWQAATTKLTSGLGKNMIQVVATSLGNPVTRALTHATVAIAQPVEIEHAMTIKRLKRADSCREWVVSMACEEMDYLREVVVRYQDSELQHIMGFACGLGAAPPWDFSQEQRSEVSDAIMKFTCSLLASEGLHCFLYCRNVPGRFFHCYMNNRGCENQQWNTYDHAGKCSWKPKRLRSTMRG